MKISKFLITHSLLGTILMFISSKMPEASIALAALCFIVLIISGITYCVLSEESKKDNE